MQLLSFLLLCVVPLFGPVLGVEWARNALFSFRDKIDTPNAVALTFDDGPHQILTPKLLDILKEKGAKATFFVMGVKVDLHPDIVARENREGHEVANHAWDHPVLSKLKFPVVHDQLNRTSASIFEAINKHPSSMRPPYGNTNGRLNKYISNDEGLTVVMWSLDTLDWKRPSPDEIVKNTMSRIKPGEIILCHDIHPGTIEAMPKLIDALHEKGWKLLTVSELLNLKTHKNLRG